MKLSANSTTLSTSTLLFFCILFCGPLLAQDIIPGDTHGMEPDYVEVISTNCDQCDTPSGIYMDNVYDPTQILSIPDIVYTKPGAGVQQMDIYFVPNNCENRPIVFFLPGSGFQLTAGLPRKAQISINTAYYFAMKGYVVAVVDYQRYPSPFDGFYTFNSVVHMAAKHIIAALQYTVGYQNALKVDPHNMFIMGHSAGGVAGLSALFSDDGGNLLGIELDPSIISNDAMNNQSQFPNENNYTVKAFSGISTGVPTENVFTNRARYQDLSLLFIHADDDPVVPYGKGSALYPSPANNKQKIIARMAGPDFMVDQILASNQNNCFKLRGVESNQHNLFSLNFPTPNNYPNYALEHAQRSRDFFYDRLICNPDCYRYRVIEPNGPDYMVQYRRPSDTTEDSDMNSEESPITIFPNPAVDQVFIDGLNEEAPSRVEFYNMAGKLVYSENANALKNTINVSLFASGLYIVRVTSNWGTSTQKITIR